MGVCGQAVNKRWVAKKGALLLRAALGDNPTALPEQQNWFLPLTKRFEDNWKENHSLTLCGFLSWMPNQVRRKRLRRIEFNCEVLLSLDRAVDDPIAASFGLNYNRA